MNNEKEYLEFITHYEAPPTLLNDVVKKDIALSFRGSSIVGKFLFFQLMGALFSLTVCPQFGIGMVEGHGITHSFRMIGDWACAAFCGALFLSSGVMLAFIGMKGEELWWVWRRYKFSLIILPAILWSALMLGNITLDLDGESLSYHLVWISAAILAQYLWMQTRSKIYWNHQLDSNL